MPVKMILDNTTQLGDIVRGGDNIDLDDGLDAAVLISLFTHRRAASTDDLPDGPGSDRQGWWGDTYSRNDGHQIGSRLWLLNRATLSDDTVNQAKSYIEEALQWMINDGLAETITVDTFRRGDLLCFQVDIARPLDPTSHYSRLWEVRTDAL